MNTINFSFEPNQEHLNQIETWLKAEYLKSHSGFYVNWQNSVLFSHSLNRMLVILKDDQAIGFITWHPDNERVVEIQVTEIKPGLRKKGYARRLLNALTEHLFAQGISILTLHCQPAESEKAWKKMGFVKFPDVADFSEENDSEGEHLYQILLPCLTTGINDEGKDTVTLWAAEPWEANNDTPRWNWQPTFKNGTNELAVPVIYPAKRDWKIQWAASDTTIKESKVKYFQTQEIDFSDFIVITNLG